jgi:hypothetical protein
LLDSLLALRFADPCPFVAHTDFSAYIPSLGKREENKSEVAGLRSKAAGIPRGRTMRVSVKVGGRERSDRWKGESEAFSLQETDVGTERADKPPVATEARAWVRKSIDD